MKQVTITLAQLVTLNACKTQRDKFQALFGESVTFRSKKKFIAACVEHASTFSFTWAASNLLKATAWAEHQRAKATAYAEYERAKATAYAEYERATAPAWDEHQRAKATAFAEYMRAKATAFANAYWNQESPP